MSKDLSAGMMVEGVSHLPKWGGVKWLIIKEKIGTVQSQLEEERVLLDAHRGCGRKDGKHLSAENAMGVIGGHGV